MSKSDPIVSYKEKNFFYIKNKHNHRIGALAIGLTDDNRLIFTGSVMSPVDATKKGNVDPKRSRNIAFIRLENAYDKNINGARKNGGQTRYLEIGVDEKDKVNFSEVLKSLQLSNVIQTHYDVDLKDHNRKLTDQINTVLKIKTH